MTIAEWTAFLDAQPDDERTVRTPSVEEHVTGKQALRLVARARPELVDVARAGRERVPRALG